MQLIFRPHCQSNDPYPICAFRENVLLSGNWLIVVKPHKEGHLYEGYRFVAVMQVQDTKVYTPNIGCALYKQQYVNNHKYSTRHCIGIGITLCGWYAHGAC